MSNKHVFSTTLAGRPLSVEIGELAKQANGAVLVRYGDTVVLSAAVASKKARKKPAALASATTCLCCGMSSPCRAPRSSNRRPAADSATCPAPPSRRGRLVCRSSFTGTIRSPAQRTRARRRGSIHAASTSTRKLITTTITTNNSTPLRTTGRSRLAML